MLGNAIFQKAVIMLKIMPALSADDYTRPYNSSLVHVAVALFTAPLKTEESIKRKSIFSSK